MAKITKRFDRICEILPNKESIRIKVRVLRLWKVPAFLNPSDTNSVEMVLVDDQGGKIHASIRKQLLYMFDSKIIEGEVYHISCVSVVPSTGFYRTTLHPYKLMFQLKTKVQASKNPDITNYGLSLTSLGEVCAHTHEYEFLVDVIGFLTGISVEREYFRDGKVTKMVIVELTDASGKCECALFGDYVDELKKKMDKSTEVTPVVVIQFAKVKIFRDKVSIQNVINTTKIFINRDIPEAEVLKNGIAVHGIEIKSTVPVIEGRAKPSFDEEFLRMHPKKKISALASLEEDGVFAVYGIVIAIVGGQEWWYPACKCHRAVIPDSGAYFCNGCSRHVFQVTPRFKVKIEVSNGGASCIFVIFDTDMSYIMEKSCADYVSESKLNNDGPYPDDFEALVGKKMLFTVDKTVKHTMKSDGTFRVKRVCCDLGIIEIFCLQGAFMTPLKYVSQAIEVECDSSSEEIDVIEDSQVDSFLKDLIVPPVSRGRTLSQVEAVNNTVKRNLSELFDAAGEHEGKGFFKAVKIEKE